MCMGFGCNAAGVIGCRIIDSPRERLLAILTNNFVPCNGRFPTLIAILTMFFVGTAGGALSSVLSAVLLTAVIVFGIAMTFVATRLLSKTLLKGCRLPLRWNFRHTGNRRLERCLCAPSSTGPVRSGGERLS